MTDSEPITCGHCDGPHRHNECPAVARIQQAERAAEREEGGLDHA